MNCHQCNRKIDESREYKITAPDGDCFHKACLAVYEKERDCFFDYIIHNDSLFANWLGVQELVINQ